MLMLQMLLGSFIGADAIGVMTATGAGAVVLHVLQKSFTDATMEFQIWVPRPVSRFITLTNV